MAYMANGPNEGDKAPAIKLETDGGGTFDLARRKGKATVIYFYPKDDTSGCTLEAIDFTASKAEFDALGVEIVGISPDSVAMHDKFKAKHGLAVTLAADPDHTVLEPYGVWVEKSMYGRKYMGVERTTFLIDSKGRIARAWRKVKVPGHVAEVLAAAREVAGR
jgi:peroxiredoxin Q/BCP